MATPTPKPRPAPKPVKAPDLTPDDATIRDAVRALVDGMHLQTLHPITRDGIRSNIPRLLALIPGPVAAKVLAAWETESNL